MTTKRPLRARNFPSAEDEARAAQPQGRYDGPGSSFRMARLRMPSSTSTWPTPSRCAGG